MATTDRSRLLLIGWDAADWSIVSPAVDAGLLPHVGRLIDAGVMGDLLTISPISTPLVWTSMATGVRPARHGVLGDCPPAMAEAGGEASSRVPEDLAVWQVLAHAGISSAVVGWPATHPAASSGVTCVTDRYGVHPSRLAEPLADLRIHPDDLDATTLAPFVPGLARAVEERDPRIAVLAAAIAWSASVHNAATWLLEHEAPDFLAVRYGGLGAIAEAFLRYHPPRMESVSPEDYERYSGVVMTAYRYYDLMLGRLLDLAGPDVTVLLVSAHGMHADHRRPADPHAPSRRWRRRYGIFCAMGPGVPADERVYGLTLLDVAPTVLARYGLDGGRAFDGHPCAQVAPRPDRGALNQRRMPGVVLQSSDVMLVLRRVHDATASMTPEAQAARAQWLRNLAVSLIETGDHASAAEVLADLVRHEPAGGDGMLLLALCELALGRLDSCAERTRALVEARPSDAGVRALAAALATARGHVGSVLDHLQIAEQCGSEDASVWCDIGSAYAKLERQGDAQRALRAAIALDPDSARAHDGLAASLLAEGRVEDAAEAALTAVGLDHQRAGSHYHLGVALARAGWAHRAVEAFDTCLSLEPDAAAAHAWLGHLFSTRLHDPERAAFHRSAARTWQPSFSPQSSAEAWDTFHGS